MTKLILQPDYVTKPEFYEFKDEMYEFRNEVYLRFDVIDEKFETLREEIGFDMDMKMKRLEIKLTKQQDLHLGAMKEFFSHELSKSVEILSGLIDSKLDTKEVRR